MPKPYPFQEVGAEWLARRNRAYLADKPGLGKTVQAVSAATRLNVRRPAIICPAIARSVWLAHWHEWGDRTVEPEVYSYERIVQTPRLQQDILKTADLVIFDEWHYAKNPTTKRSKAAGFVANRASRVWLLSATPVPNNPSEIYTTLRAVWPHLLKGLGVWSYREFVEKFCISEPVRHSNGWGTRIIGAKNSDQLREVLSKVMLRRSVEDVELDLPRLRWENTRLHLSGDEWGVLADDLKGVATPEVVQDINLRLRRNQPLPGAPLAALRRTFGVAKAVPSVRLLAEEMDLGKYKKLVVMAYHHEVLGVLESGLKRFGLVRTDGKTAPGRRDQNIKDFQNDPDVRIFLGQYSTTGVAITLHAASELVMVEQPWGPGDIEQIARRIHRIGQKNSCRVRMFILPDTIDDAVARVRARKLRMIGSVVTT